MAITIQNLFSESREILKNLINSNVIDPDKGYTNSRRRWIYREFPDTTSNDFAGYPIIVIKSPETDDEYQDLQFCLSNSDLEFSIELYVEFNDENARIDSLSNSVYKVLRNFSNMNSLAKKNLHLQNIQAGPFDNQEEAGKKLSTRSFTITFESTLEA